MTTAATATLVRVATSTRARIAHLAYGLNSATLCDRPTSGWIAAPRVDMTRCATCDANLPPASTEDLPPAPAPVVSFAAATRRNIRRAAAAVSPYGLGAPVVSTALNEPTVVLPFLGARYVGVSTVGSDTIHLAPATVLRGVMIPMGGKTLCDRDLSRMRESYARGRVVTCAICLHGLSARRNRDAELAAAGTPVTSDIPLPAPASVSGEAVEEAPSNLFDGVEETQAFADQLAAREEDEARDRLIVKRDADAWAADQAAAYEFAMNNDPAVRRVLADGEDATAAKVVADQIAAALAGAAADTAARRRAAARTDLARAADEIVVAVELHDDEALADEALDVHEAAARLAMVGRRDLGGPTRLIGFKANADVEADLDVLASWFSRGADEEAPELTRSETLRLLITRHAALVRRSWGRLA